MERVGKNRFESFDLSPIDSHYLEGVPKFRYLCNLTCNQGNCTATQSSYIPNLCEDSTQKDTLSQNSNGCELIDYYFDNQGNLKHHQIELTCRNAQQIILNDGTTLPLQNGVNKSDPLCYVAGNVFKNCNKQNYTNWVGDIPCVNQTFVDYLCERHYSVYNCSEYGSYTVIPGFNGKAIMNVSYLGSDCQYGCQGESCCNFETLECNKWNVGTTWHVDGKPYYCEYNYLTDNFTIVSSNQANVPEICFDGIDDNANGKIDAQDHACQHKLCFVNGFVNGNFGISDNGGCNTGVFSYDESTHTVISARDGYPSFNSTMLTHYIKKKLEQKCHYSSFTLNETFLRNLLLRCRNFLVNFDFKNVSNGAIYLSGQLVNAVSTVDGEIFCFDNSTHQFGNCVNYKGCVNATTLQKFREDGKIFDHNGHFTSAFLKASGIFHNRVCSHSLSVVSPASVCSPCYTSYFNNLTHNLGVYDCGGSCTSGKCVNGVGVWNISNGRCKVVSGGSEVRYGGKVCEYYNLSSGRYNFGLVGYNGSAWKCENKSVYADSNPQWHFGCRKLSACKILNFSYSSENGYCANNVSGTYDCCARSLNDYLLISFGDHGLKQCGCYDNNRNNLTNIDCGKLFFIDTNFDMHPDAIVFWNETSKKYEKARYICFDSDNDGLLEPKTCNAGDFCVAQSPIQSLGIRFGIYNGSVCKSGIFVFGNDHALLNKHSCNHIGKSEGYVVNTSKLWFHRDRHWFKQHAHRILFNCGTCNKYYAVSLNSSKHFGLGVMIFLSDDELTLSDFLGAYSFFNITCKNSIDRNSPYVYFNASTGYVVSTSSEYWCWSHHNHRFEYSPQINIVGLCFGINESDGNSYFVVTWNGNRIIHHKLARYHS